MDGAAVGVHHVFDVHSQWIVKCVRISELGGGGIRVFTNSMEQLYESNVSV